MFKPATHPQRDPPTSEATNAVKPILKRESPSLSLSKPPLPRNRPAQGEARKKDLVSFVDEADKPRPMVMPLSTARQQTSRQDGETKRQWKNRVFDVARGGKPG